MFSGSSFRTYFTCSARSGYTSSSRASHATLAFLFFPLHLLSIILLYLLLLPSPKVRFAGVLY